MYGYIYKITNLVNNKVYVGLTTQTPKDRKYQHFYLLKQNNHWNFHLQRSFNKFGKSNFKFSILTWANSKEELDQLEIHFIYKYDSLNSEKGFNSMSGGSNGKHSKEVCNKISKSMTGTNNPFYGLKHSTKTKGKMSNAKIGNIPWNYGKKLSKIHREKLSKAKLGKNGKLCPNLGKQHGKYRGTFYVHKTRNPWTRVWQTQIRYKNYPQNLGYFEDPISGEIVYDFVFKEIYRE